MQRPAVRASVAVFACTLILLLTIPGDAWAQRSAAAKYYPPSYGPTYGYYVAPSPVYGVRPGYGFTPSRTRIVPSYTVPAYVAPAPRYYGGPHFNQTYYGGPAVDYLYW